MQVGWLGLGAMGAMTRPPSTSATARTMALDRKLPRCLAAIPVRDSVVRPRRAEVPGAGGKSLALAKVA